MEIEQLIKAIQNTASNMGELISFDINCFPYSGTRITVHCSDRGCPEEFKNISDAIKYLESLKKKPKPVKNKMMEAQIAAAESGIEI